MAEAIEASMTLASQRVVGEWVSRVGAQSLSGRSETLRRAFFIYDSATCSSPRFGPSWHTSRFPFTCS